MLADFEFLPLICVPPYVVTSYDKGRYIVELFHFLWSTELVFGSCVLHFSFFESSLLRCLSYLLF